MAGIGFELKRIYGRKTLAANIWGTIYATMTTITPAIVSAVLLLLLKFLLDESGLTVLESRCSSRLPRTPSWSPRWLR